MACLFARSLAADMEHHRNDGRRGERIRDGLTIALVGAPNAGKSTLLNYLAKREAAIVFRPAGDNTRCVRGASGSFRVGRNGSWISPV